MRNIFLTSITIVLLLIGGVSCQKSSDQIKICFSFQDLETEFWVAAHQAITESLREQGVKVIESNANQDANRQLEQIRDAIAQNVDGIIAIVQDGESALTIIKEANEAGVPIGIFNRPPANDSKSAIVVVADNESIAELTTEYMAKEAKSIGKKVLPLILVGDLGDPNAVARRKGFYNVIDKNPDVFEKPIEVPTKWDASTALANLEAAIQSNPNVGLVFTSSDFLYPQIRAVLEQRGKWKKRGEKGHIILGGIDGDATACKWMDDGFIDATGVQDLYFEADTIMATLLTSIKNGDKAPKAWIKDKGFALTQENLKERRADMWGSKILDAKSKK